MNVTDPGGRLEYRLKDPGSFASLPTRTCTRLEGIEWVLRRRRINPWIAWDLEYRLEAGDYWRTILVFDDDADDPRFAPDVRRRRLRRSASD